MAVRTWCLLLGFAIATVGCQHSLSQQQKASLSGLEVFVCSSQDAISALPEPDPPRQSVITPITTSTGKTDQTASLVVGLAGAVLTGIDRGMRRRTAKAHATQITEALKTFDFRSDLVDAARTELAKVTAMKIDARPADATANCWEAMTAALYDQSKSSALLYVDVSYFLYSDGDRVGFVADAWIYPRPSVGPAIYSRTLKYDFLYNPRRDVRDTFKGAAHVSFSKLAADLNRP